MKVVSLSIGAMVEEITILVITKEPVVPSTSRQVPVGMIANVPLAYRVRFISSKTEFQGQGNLLCA
jgi:hypothetical protein